MGLSVNNFCLDIGVWSYIDSGYQLYVDVTDDVYTVVSSGTYFSINGSSVTTNLSSISGGYRLSYIIPTTISGQLLVTVNGKNSNFDEISKTYDLITGYRIEVTDSIGMNYGQSINVVTSVSDSAICPKTVSDIVKFTTKDLYYSNIGASIIGVPVINLNAVLRTQSTFFYYGKTYTINISGIKDFSGNVLPPFSFTFTIGDF